MTANARRKFLAAVLCLALAFAQTGCSARGEGPPRDLNLDPGLLLPVAAGAVAESPQLLLLAQMPGKPVVQLVRQTATGSVSDIPLAVPQTLAVTRPAKPLTTTYEKYFIMGTSNPAEPVYFGNEEIERQGGGGTFGVLVPLALGANTFQFSQGGKTASITITRVAPAGAVPISVITQSSMVPAVHAGAKVGEVIELGCTAPSGAKVTARFDGQAVPLSQAVTATPGTPAQFKGGLEIMGDYPDGETVNAGKVQYTLEHGGKTTTFTSTGDVYVAGKNAEIAVRVEIYLGFVYPDTSDVSVFREKLKQGAVDTIKSQSNTYFELSSGGWIHKEHVSILTGAPRIECKLGEVTTAANNREESYIFTGNNAPAYLTELRDGSFFITFFNTEGTPRAGVAASRLFSTCAASSDNSAVTYEFTLKDAGLLWGYNLAYEEGDIVLTFRYKPKLGTADQPLAGVTVLLDPGHGGTDPGALGMAGETGPTEREFNMAHAYAVRDALAAMGANVLFTHTGGAYLSLDDRLLAIERDRADLFISLHHNSLGENTDGNKVSGVEVYYHTPGSEELAETMLREVTTPIGRGERFVEQSYYRVTLSNYAPSILVELGFMCNPLEYERAADPAEIQKAGQAVAAGVKNLLAARPA